MRSHILRRGSSKRAASQRSVHQDPILLHPSGCFTVMSYVTWEETYEFTFNSLHKPNAIHGENTASIGTERNLWNQYIYGLEDSAAERAKLDDHASHFGYSQCQSPASVHRLCLCTPMNTITTLLAAHTRPPRAVLPYDDWLQSSPQL